jgi:hypothetical protein
MTNVVNLSEEQWRRLHARAESLADVVWPTLVQEPPAIAARAVECLIAKIMDGTGAEFSLSWAPILREMLDSFEAMDKAEIGGVA